MTGEEVISWTKTYESAATPQDEVPLDLKTISLDNGCGFLPSPCLFDIPIHAIQELNTALYQTSGYTGDDEVCFGTIPKATEVGLKLHRV